MAERFKLNKELANKLASGLASTHGGRYYGPSRQKIIFFLLNQGHKDVEIIQHFSDPDSDNHGRTFKKFKESYFKKGTL